MSDVSRDVSPVVQAALPATGFELVLHIEGYEFPQFHPGWDAHAYAAKPSSTSSRCGSFHASHRPIIYSVELERFAHQLRALDQDRTGEASLEHGATRSA